MISATHKRGDSKFGGNAIPGNFAIPTDVVLTRPSAAANASAGSLRVSARPHPEPRAKRFCEIASALAVCINQNDMPNTERQQRIRDRSPRATCAKLNDAIPSDVS